MERHNVFAGAFVDRNGEKRKDPEWIAAAAAGADSRFVPVWRDRCLVSGDPPRLRLLDAAAAGGVPDDDEELVFLGLFHDRPAFAFAASGDAPPYADVGEFADLRYIGTALPPDEANLAAHARALMFWHRTTLYCMRCGSPSRPDAGGNTRRCVNVACDRIMFPRVDPAIIVLVSDGERCLLGRQPSWPEGLYSTIAGFVEPGESLEDAVRREVFEETNIHVGGVRYHSSQPWPFPSSLMLGFIADARSADIARNDGELQDARWFTRGQLGGDFPKLPQRISIARRLIDYWRASRED
jgi:NAD+ diphosphatase